MSYYGNAATVGELIKRLQKYEQTLKVVCAFEGTISPVFVGDLFVDEGELTEQYRDELGTKVVVLVAE